jgi:hydroxypyruvate reductase
MATALESHAKSHWLNTTLEGLVLTRYGHHSPTSHIQIIEAGHPVPDQAGMDGAKAVLAIANQLQADDVLIALVSGGGSSLLTLPQVGISIEDMRITTEALLRSGAPIEEMNIVRKHLSAILGGHMAREAVARGAEVSAFLISDVTGDDPSSIASGPCAPDESTFADALDILKDYDLLNGAIPKAVTDYLQAGVKGDRPETPKSDV